jgi:hypothetical protein
MVGDAELDFSSRVSNRVKCAKALVLNHVKIDAIQDTIVTENVLAIMGASLPVLSTLACYVTGANWIDYIGEMLNGVIQLKLGSLIVHENTKILLGDGLSPVETTVRVRQRIKGIMQSHDKVLEVNDFFSEHISNTQLKISAKVLLDKQALLREVLDELSHDFKRLPQAGDFHTQLEEVAARACSRTLKLSEELMEKFEDDIRTHVPNARHINLKPLVKDFEERTAGAIDRCQIYK